VRCSVEDSARRYERWKIMLFVVRLVVTYGLLLVALCTPLSSALRECAYRVSPNQWGAVFFYFLFFSLYVLVFMLPLGWVSGYILEHRYSLSTQRFSSWCWEECKKQLLSFGLCCFLVEGLYFLIRTFPHAWWVIAWGLWILFSLGMAKLFPVVIIPLFYRYGEVEDTALKERICSFVERHGLRVGRVSSINLSKTTKKANAAFCGMGNTKRVLLSDTLLEAFDHDEIEVVVAHEVAHYRRRHIWKQMGLGVVLSFVCFLAVFVLMGRWGTAFGLQGPADVAAFPLLGLIAGLFHMVTSPVENGYSRRHEFEADNFAVEAVEHKDAFLRLMDKLANMNLANRTPHWLVEFLLYNHPSIGRRIENAKRIMAQ